MKIVATSDLHGHLPEIPQCDLLLIAGDVCPASNHNKDFQLDWIRHKFEPWLLRVPADALAMTWGNHDFIGQQIVTTCGLRHASLLVDRMQLIAGLKIWGSPWTLEFNDWAFNLSTDKLAKLHRQIPKCDIILTHGPPLGYGDLCPDGFRAGSAALTVSIERIQPMLVVYGHIHSGQGTQRIGNSIVANVAHVNEQYQPFYPPQVFEI